MTEPVKPVVPNEQPTPVVAPQEPVTPVVTPPAEPVKQEPVKQEPVSSKSKERLSAFVEEAGLVPSEVAEEVRENDGKITPDIYKALVSKHGEGVAALIADQITSTYSKNKEVASQTDAAIYKQVEESFKGVTEQSGAESWKELAGWAKTAIPSEERGEINKLLSQGGMATKLAVESLIQRFNNREAEPQEAELLDGDGLLDTFGGKPLDKASYDRELRELLSKGHDYDTSPEVQKLNARRLKSIKRGK